ncbi:MULTISPECIES: bifunctional diguanylate cyclase/phosphodiesterase [Deefgea]|uniref:bifunctional diguanylate cyclase/phosphodiesterase n=1 Tax=Deefgea TaxID=400947 RepID=UPI001942362A|nr:MULTISPECIES: EAL domain-containing protein [Deefgea]MBM9889736.1 EAL domain-containing protein [Deefgea sp. CFH1-16]
MSLIRQMLVLIIISTLLAFSVSLVVSTVSARNYLEQQLYTQSSDNASSLALSLSQQTGDPAMMELMTSALFDSGHFELIRFRDPHKKIIIELKNQDISSKVPAWFISAFPIQVTSGQALVSQGWKQAGSVEVRAHSKFAYESLWNGAVKLFFAIMGGGIIVAFLVRFMFNRVRQPIRDMVGQAEAISERRFITIAEPPYVELRRVVVAMNSMVMRVKSMFDEQSERIDQLNHSINRDSVTGLANRNFFMARLSGLLHDEDRASHGFLLLIRLKDLAALNQRLGRQQTDALLNQIAAVLAHWDDEGEDWIAARLNGADFALATPMLEQAAEFVDSLLATLAQQSDVEDFIHIGYTEFSKHEAVSAILTRADAALAQAESRGVVSAVAAVVDWAPIKNPNTAWRERLLHAIQSEQLVVQKYPVIDWQGRLIHQELMLRMPDTDGSSLLSAGIFMPFAKRLGLTSELDLAAIRLAIAELKRNSYACAVNLDIESLSSLSFRAELAKLLQTLPEAVRTRLWLEINSNGFQQEFESLAVFAAEMNQAGVKVGIEHFGRSTSGMLRLYDLPLSYIKIDGSYIHEIDQHTGNQQLLKEIVKMATSLGVDTIAEQVRTEGEWHKLQALGLSGATGSITNSKMN